MFSDHIHISTEFCDSFEKHRPIGSPTDSSVGSEKASAVCVALEDKQYCLISRTDVSSPPGHQEKMLMQNVGISRFNCGVFSKCPGSNDIESYML